MAYLARTVSARTGLVRWRVQFQKRVYGKGRKVKIRLCFNATFKTESEALEFVEEYEHIFFLQEPGEPEYDVLVARRKRKFSHRLKDKA